jgi:hypothetical protein
MKYRVHRFDLKMTSDQHTLEMFPNSLAMAALPVQAESRKDQWLSGAGR